MSDQIDLNIHRTVQPKAREYMSFSNTHETLSKMIEHTLSHKKVLINSRKLKLY